MSFKFEIRDSALVVRFGGDEFGAGDAAQLSTLLASKQAQPCIVNLRTPEVIEDPEALEAIQEEWFDKGFPMVFVIRPAHNFLFSEDCVWVESHQEAVDWIADNEE